MSLPVLALLLACGSTPSLADGPGTLVTELRSKTVNESSGLVLASTPDHYWTHNDSGGAAELYAFDATGALTATWVLAGLQAVDWEELAAFERDGKRWLLVADTGDNKRVRDRVTLHLVEEPPTDRSGTAPVARTLAFRYPDGPHDCEAVTVDAAQGTIALITKERGDGIRVYTLPLDPPGKNVLTATQVATLDLAPAGDLSGRRVVAMDTSPDGTRVGLLTYTRAWIYAREPGEDWAATFGRAPSHQLELPILQQGEALAFDRDGTRLLLTSEGVPMPLVALPLDPRETAPTARP